MVAPPLRCSPRGSALQPLSRSGEFIYGNQTYGRASSPSVATQLMSITVLSFLRIGCKTSGKSSSDEKIGAVAQPT